MILPPTWNLPEAIRLRLGQTTYGRQRAIAEEGQVLLVLHRPPGADDSAREGVLFWRNTAGEWQSSRGGSGPGTLKRHVQGYAEIETKLTQDYEQAQSPTALFDLLEAIVPMDRAARNMHQALQSAREAVKGDTFLIEMRDLAYEIERNFELLSEDVRNAIQYRMAREAEAQAHLSREALRASHRLNILAALCLPLTALASLCGMSFTRGMDEYIPPMFWIVLVVGVTMGLVLKTWILAPHKPAGAPASKTGSNVPPKVY